MTYTARHIANAFLDLANEEGKSLTPLKLQKLVYIAHGWSLAIFDRPLVHDEFPEAWQYGPVFPSLYHEFKEYGRSAVTAKAKIFERSGPGIFDFKATIPEIPRDDARTLDFIKTVWSKYGGFSGLALSDATHRPDTPWSKVMATSGGARNADINNEIIKEHYRTLATTRSQKASS